MIVLDASFLVKLVLEEDGSEKARSLIRAWAREGRTLLTVDSALSEALNAIWKHAVKVGDLNREEAMNSSRDLLMIWSKMRTYPSENIVVEALKLALEEGVTVYDALYIQLAESVNAALATFDKELSMVASRHGIETYP
jgi:predicted nucleic acid-binding protein